jgi:glycosyltransferase involved in cell wall biosynthesis
MSRTDSSPTDPSPTDPAAVSVAPRSAPEPSSTTVVVPTRNRPEYLRAALASVLGQRGGAPRVIVVDDASSPPVPPIANVEVVRLDTRRGTATARNLGLERVSTDWVAFLDDDDLWAPSKLAQQCKALANEPAADWCYTAALVIDDRAAIVGVQRAETSGWVEGALLRGNLVSGGGSTVLARTSLVREAGGFNSAIRAAEDWELWVRIAALSPVAAVDAPLAAWRDHATSKSHGWEPAAVAGLESVLRARADVLGVPFEHLYRHQIAIDQHVEAADGVSAARAYWQRFRVVGHPRDVVSAGAVRLAPTVFRAIKRRARARAVPREWFTDTSWLAAAMTSAAPSGAV